MDGAEMVKAYNRSLYPASRPVLTSAGPATMTWLAIARGLLPTFGVVLAALLVMRFTASGYSVVVVMLLSVMIYTTYRFGTMIGIIGSVLIVLFNFYAVSIMVGSELLSLKTLDSGAVIAVAFPMLAYIVGRLKTRNDALLLREQDARKKAEESARQLQFMAESMPQKIFTTRPNGAGVYMNSQWSEYTGSSKKKMRHWGSVVHPQDMKENMRQWREALENGTPFQFEHRLRRSDGTYVWHLTRAQPLRDKRGKITLWIGSSTDIEDVRRARKLAANTARLIKQRTELMELNKAKDDFISLASHQLRTPATGVKQYINMALDGYAGELSPQLRQFLETANNSNERQLAIINDLLRVAQIDAGKVVLRKERFDLDEMIRSALRDQQSTFADRQQSASYEHPKGRMMMVRADPTKLRMVLENVIDNASKYSYDNTHIVVTAKKYRGQIRIAIRDQGVGIDKSDREKVFEKFSRLDNPLSTKVGGNGLGLYWVRKVVELHGGSITATSHVGDGVTFTVTLPADEK